MKEKSSGKEKAKENDKKKISKEKRKVAENGHSRKIFM